MVPTCQRFAEISKGDIHSSWHCTLLVPSLPLPLSTSTTAKSRSRSRRCSTILFLIKLFFLWSSSIVVFWNCTLLVPSPPLPPSTSTTTRIRSRNSRNTWRYSTVCCWSSCSCWVALVFCILKLYLSCILPLPLGHQQQRGKPLSSLVESLEEK